MIYRETIVAGVMPSSEVLSQVLGCLKLPYDASLKNRLIENMGLSADSSRPSKLCSLIDGFCEYDPRAFSLLEVSWDELLNFFLRPIYCVMKLACNQLIL